MQKKNSDQLLNELQADVRQMIADATKLQYKDPAVLVEEPAPGKWSVVQVLAHLNTYSSYYHKAIGKAMEQPKVASAFFKPGWLGNYFTKMMKPTAEGTIAKKMKAPKNARPAAGLDITPQLESFIAHQKKLLELLEKAREKNLGNIRVPISIAQWIRLKLGDTFRFLIAHEQRHFIQIQKTIAALEKQESISL